ncbi:MAG: hypothetical protein BIFFINMI_03567 [Phycisphaerae bacterium]|nr:hypothetical protein [Phycisphaerae bacterium]
MRVFGYSDEIDKAEVAFTGLAGSAENARVIIAKLRDISTASGMSFTSLQLASRKLLAAGVSADQLEPILKNLGDVAAGTGGDIGGLADIFAKAGAAGGISSREFMSFASQGIPMLDALAKHFGTTTDGVKKLATDGKIGMADLQAALASMTAQGGKFHGILAAQEQTVGNQFRRMGDTLLDTAADIVRGVESAFGVGNLFGSIADGLAVVGNVIVNGLNFIKPALTGIKNFIINSVGTVWTAIRPFVMAGLNFLTTTLPAVFAVFASVAQQIWAVWVNVWGSIVGFVQPIVSGIAHFIGAYWGEIVDTTVANFMAVYNFTATVFGAVWEVVKSIWSGIVAAWDWGCNLILGHTADTASGTAGFFATIWGWVKWLANGVKLGFQVATYAITHWKDTLKLVGVAVAYFVVKTWNQLKYTFTTVIPAMLKWFGKHWKDVFIDVFNFTKTIFTNLVKNIVKLIKSIPKLITGKTTFSEIWTPLTDGFESRLKDMPQIAERIPSETEKVLGEQLDKLAGDYGNDLSKYLDEQDKKAADVGKSVKKAIQSGADSVKPPKPLTDLAKKPIAPEIKPTVNPQDLAVSVSVNPELRLAKLTKWGSAAMWSGVAVAGASRRLSLPTPKGGNAPVATPVASPAGAGGAAAGQAAAKADDTASDIAWIRRLMVKWDSNPNYAVVSM